MKTASADRASVRQNRARIGVRNNSPEQTTCTHCGKTLGESYVVSGGNAFCCNGCAGVYASLADSGTGEEFYSLQVLSSGHKPAQPTASDQLQLRELDTPQYLETHTQERGSSRHAELFVDGMHCAGCVWLIERLPFELEGVSEARVDLSRARMSLTFDPDVVKLSAVADWLARFGYTIGPSRGEDAAQSRVAERKLLMRMGVTWALAGNVMLIAFALYSGLSADNTGLHTAARWTSLALALPAVLYGGAPFFLRAWGSVRSAFAARDFRRLHMDTPIALGIFVGFAHSAWATISGTGEVWFDSIAVLIAALLTARWLQLRSRRLAGEASDRLLTLVPSMTRRVSEDGEIEVVRVDNLRPGDLVHIPAGEVTPVDGIVERGESRLNNAVITGESRPEAIGPGGSVVAGATNISSPLYVRVNAAGEGTRIGQLLAWVRDAESHRAPVVLLADRMGGYFVLAVLTLAVLSAGLWMSIDSGQAAAHVVALLVITCPCALGMATPLAMSVAAGRAARRGLFIKSDEATQLLTTVDAVVLDKTGTLTEGRMVLVEWTGSKEALELVAALEAHSNHPISDAILRSTTTFDHPDVQNFEAVAGLGIKGVISGQDLTVGRPDWVLSEVGASPVLLQNEIDSAASDGYTPVLVAIENEIVGLAVIGDQLRDDAEPLVRALEREGKEVHILSGDHPEAVAVVARRLGLPSERAHGGVSPEDKLAAVQRLQENGCVVLMVGDGVNDAVALQAADVGVAVSGGSTASLVAADVFMTRPGVAPISDLLDGSNAVMRTIRIALGVSLLYNVAGASAAIGGLVTPLVAAIAMPISSLLVVSMAILQPSFRKTSP